MSYVPESRQLGGIDVSKTSDSSSFQIKYFVLDADLDSYIPEIGAVASWAPEYSVVKSFSKTWYGPGCWLVSIKAGSSDSSLTKQSSDLGDFIRKSYTLQDINLPMEWWGAWKAAVSDAPQFTSDGKLAAGEHRYLNIKGAWCNPGDFIFCNAVPYEVASDGTEKADKTSALKGSADYSNSPFDTGSLDLSVSLIGQTVKTKLYVCSFYTKRLPQNISDFVGVNGEFTGSCRPSDSASGRWKAMDQSVENVRDNNGNVWTHVVRTMLQAPLSLKWDAAKNGGTWKW